MLMVTMAATAQSVVVENVTAKTYEDASIRIVLKGAASYTAMGFSLELPQNFMVASEMNNGVMNYMISANNDFIDDHTVASKMNSNSNTMRVAVFSEKNKPFKSGDDIILTITVKTSGKLGIYPAKLKSLELANSSNNLVTLPDVPFIIAVGGMIGDVNEDSKITVSDVMAQLNIILGRDGGTQPKFNHEAADINRDENITVADVMSLVKNIMSGDVEIPTAPGLCPDNNHPHMIDLGLPSGVKWSCCNLGALNPEGTGCYYAWGETTGSCEGKNYFDWQYYQYNHFDSNNDNSYFGYSLTKYCQDSEYGYNGFTDNLKTLSSEDDAASVKWGEQWRMPSKAEANELMNKNYTSWTVTTLNDVIGIQITSLVEGYTDNSIFIPLTGMFDGRTIDDFGDYAEYWTSTIDNRFPNSAYRINLNSEGKKGTGTRERDTGLTIRPVFDESPALQHLSLSVTSLGMLAGQETTIQITSGNGNYTVTSSDVSVATAMIEGNSVKVSAVGDGTATITVIDSSTGVTATIELTVTVSLCPDDNHPHMINLGLPSGTLWSCCNIDTTNPDDQSPTHYGGYYAWGETEEKNEYSWSSYIHCNGSSSTCHDIGSDIAGTQYDVAHVKWGGFWVMPTSNQLDELYNNCTYTWTVMNGVSGGLFTSVNGGKIFFPATGCRWYDSIDGADTYGNCWSSSLSSTLAWDLYFTSGRVRRDGDQRAFGYAVRPVFLKTSAPLQLSESNISLVVGRETFVEITSGNGSYTVSSSDESVAIALIEGNLVKVSAVGVGTSTITVTSTKSGDIATIEVMVNPAPAPVSYLTCPDNHHPHLIDLGLPSGTKWACCNVGATTPEVYGGYYAWGETVEKDVYNINTYIYYDGNYKDLGTDISGTQYDVAHVKWGGSWMMPNLEQLKELCNNCSYTWTSVNGIIGGQFTGSNGGTIFLPVAGERIDDGISNNGTYGFYWTSSKDSNSSYYAYANDLYFNSTRLYTNHISYRIYGNTVRPVVK